MINTPGENLYIDYVDIIGTWIDQVSIRRLEQFENGVAYILFVGAVLPQTFSSRAYYSN